MMRRLYYLFTVPLLISFSPLLATDTPTDAPISNEVVKEPSPIDITSSTALYKASFMRTILFTLGLLLIFFLIIWLIRRFPGSKLQQGRGKQIKVIEKRMISPKSSLYLIEVGEKQVLISESQADMRLIQTFDWNEPKND